MKLNEKLVRLRKEKGLTQSELAETMKVSRQAVSRWEMGAVMPSTENLRGLSELYGVPIDYLFNDGEVEMNTTDPHLKKPENDPEILCRDTKRPTMPIKWATIAVLLLILGIFIGMSTANRQNEEKPHLYMGDMKGEDVTRVPKMEFSIEW